MATRISFRYLLKRVLVSVVVIWALLTILFLLLKAMPGDITTRLLNPNIKPADLQNLREQYGLDEPLWVQYLKWVRNYMVLDFGYSLRSPTPVIDLIIERLPRTLVLFTTAYLLNLTIGTLAGIEFGWKRGSVEDRTGFMGGLTLYSIPDFWLAWLLLLVFSYQQFGLTWFPPGKMTPSFESAFSSVELFTGVLWHLVLPVVSLSAVGWAGYMLVMRTSMQETLGEEYIQTARAKGLSPTAVKYKHAARNAMIPVTTQAIVGIAFLIDGSVIVETVFSWPGIGALLVRSILNRNFPVALAAFFMLGVLIVALRLVTDIVYTYLDPRIKFGENQ
jgi:peptide/nickel transport system permease protein